MVLFRTKASAALGALIAWSLLLCATVLTSEACADIFHIDSVRVNAPKIRNDSLIYTLDIYFFEKPPKFFSYYDDDSGTVNIELLDAQVIVPAIRLPKGVPFLGFKTKKMDSDMSITKQVTKVFLAVDKGERRDQLWNSDAKLGQKNSLRITIWKEKNQEQRVAQRKTRVWAIVGSVTIVAALAVVAVILYVPALFK